MYLIKHGIHIVAHSNDIAVAKGMAIQFAQAGTKVTVYQGKTKIQTFDAYTDADRQALKADISDKPVKAKAKAKAKAKSAPVPEPVPVCLAKAIGWYGLMERI